MPMMSEPLSTTSTPKTQVLLTINHLDILFCHTISILLIHLYIQDVTWMVSVFRTTPPPRGSIPGHPKTLRTVPWLLSASARLVISLLKKEKDFEL